MAKSKVDRMRDISRAYWHATGRLSEARRPSPGKFNFLPVQAIVCAAFGLEIAFKAVIIHGGGAPWGHDLKALFDELPSEIQSEIRGHFKDGAAFDAGLVGIAKAFDEWRYVFEGEYASIDLQFITALADIAYMIVDDDARWLPRE